MPFLHWEVKEEVEKLKKILKEHKDRRDEEKERAQATRAEEMGGKQNAKEAKPPQTAGGIKHSRAAKEAEFPRPSKETGKENGTERLYRMYLDDEHPLHIRRTLDQFYYHTFPNTDERDNDQTALRYFKKHKLSEKESTTIIRPILTMVDQLWMWVLPECGGSPPTIITAFPQRCSRVVSPNSQGTTALISNIIEKAQDLEVKGTHGLAETIAGECSRIYFDATSDRDPSIQFLEIYTTSIGDIVSAFFLHKQLYSN